jgi:hypothetical protein
VICTERGRVKYHRAPHLFRYTDVLRIVDQVEPVRMTDLKGSTEDGLAIIGTILAANSDLLKFLAARGLSIFPDMDLAKFLAELATLLVRILVRTPAHIGARAFSILGALFIRSVEKKPKDATLIREETNGENSDQG